MMNINQSEVQGPHRVPSHPCEHPSPFSSKGMRLYRERHDDNYEEEDSVLEPPGSYYYHHSDVNRKR